jgi:hypothetical protein
VRTRSALIVFALLAACAAPSVPLPPPTALVEGPPDAMGFVTVNGQARPNAFVSCLNENSDEGVIVRADMTGIYSLRLEAATGDMLSLWQFEGTPNGGMQVHVSVP